MTGRMLATKTFTIEHQLVGGEMLTGQFTVTRMSAAMIAREAILRAQYVGGAAVDEDALARAHVMSRLDTVLLTKPAWFNWEELAEDPLEDNGVAMKVYEVARLFLDGFRRQPVTASPQNGAGQPGDVAGVGGQGAGAAQHPQPGLVGSGAGILQGGVSASLDA